MNIHLEQTTFVSLVPFQRGGWHGWVSSTWRELEDFASLDAWLQDVGREVILDLPCRTITRHETSRGAVYAKCMRGRNDAAVKKKEVISWLKWRFLKSRGQHIVQITAKMISKGHNCPAPVLGVSKKGKWGYPTELYVSQELKLPTLEDELLKNNDKFAQANLLSFAAEKLALLHRDNFVHGDFLARNVCLDWAGQKLYFLDNDRTRHWPFSPPFWRPRRNLAQFCYNLMLLDGAGDSPLPEAFLRSYAEMRPDWPVSRRQGEVARVLQQVQQRWERDGEWELARRRQKQAAAAAKADAQAGCEPKVQL